ncbi:hypothetical protein Sango_2895200 [Sesamum angolense]|uniref:Uncharacterized protein n=1 Tax=Sesamum angolense TaxID=2727404 RepID=A0AAE1T5W4_9LAMI|nr:hypothetical protein Sango_2895200 [Sesamum angolense]
MARFLCAGGYTSGSSKNVKMSSLDTPTSSSRPSLTPPPALLLKEERGVLLCLSVHLHIVCNPDLLYSWKRREFFSDYINEGCVRIDYQKANWIGLNVICSDNFGVIVILFMNEGSTPEERVTFFRWHEDNWKVLNIVLALMTNDIQKQYDRHDDVASIMLRMKEVYAVPDRHVRYVAIKDLQAGLDNDTYIDMILQSLPPSYEPFVVNYNMNGLEKSINELINMLVQYELTTKKSEPSVLVEEASTSKSKGKGARRWKRKKGKAKDGASTLSAPIALVGMGKGKGKVVPSQSGQMMLYALLGKGYGAHICNDLQVLKRSRKLSRDEVVLKLGNGKAVTAEAVGIVHLATTSKLLNMAPFETVAQTLYQISHDKPASYKYLRVWGSPAYVKRLVGDKLD